MENGPRYRSFPVTPATRKLLEAADDPVNLEFPDCWLERYEPEMARVRAIGATLEAVVGERLELDDQIQDASHFAELRLRGPVQGDVIPARLAIPFSAFGKLVTVWGSKGCELDPETMTQVIQILQSAGYVYVPPAELDEPYDGVHLHLRTHGVTWWTRFFDYL